LIHFSGAQAVVSPRLHRRDFLGSFFYPEKNEHRSRAITSIERIEVNTPCCVQTVVRKWESRITRFANWIVRLRRRSYAPIKLGMTADGGSERTRSVACKRAALARGRLADVNAGWDIVPAGVPSSLGQLDI
jgi:hypothetical protein